VPECLGDLIDEILLQKLEEEDPLTQVLQSKTYNNVKSEL